MQAERLATMGKGMQHRTGLQEKQPTDQSGTVIIRLNRIAGHATVIAGAVVQQLAHGQNLYLALNFKRHQKITT